MAKAAKKKAAKKKAAKKTNGKIPKAKVTVGKKVKKFEHEVKIEAPQAWERGESVECAIDESE